LRQIILTNKSEKQKEPSKESNFSTSYGKETKRKLGHRKDIKVMDENFQKFPIEEIS